LEKGAKEKAKGVSALLLSEIEENILCLFKIECTCALNFARRFSCMSRAVD